jgi:hypothetical protein
MLLGLQTLWLDAIRTPFLTLHWTWAGVLAGAAAGFVTALIVLVFSVRRLSTIPAARLLSGTTEPEPAASTGPARWTWPVAAFLVLAAAGLNYFAWGRSGEAQAGAFLGGGFLLLLALLLVLRRVLRDRESSHPRGGLARLALRNASRHPGRSTLSIGLMAAASFLIGALSAFRLAPPGDSQDPRTGAGGFALFAHSDQPLLFDPGTPDGRFELGFSSAQEKELADVSIHSFRVRPGDDASCLNLYQTTAPRVLGASPEFIARGGFAWAGAAAPADPTPPADWSPWRLLDSDRGLDPDGRPIVPVVLDAATAQYSLHLAGIGARYSLRDQWGRPVTLEVVGLLKNSVLQGDLILGEARFRELFPDNVGRRVFLIAAPPDRATAVSDVLERTLGDFGFDVEPTRARLERFLSVQNTYLSTFQILGALGLLLGVPGLAAVQLRNIFERRAELGLMRATGFSPARLSALVLLENGFLLLAGLAAGALPAALTAWFQQQAGGITIPWGQLLLILAAVLVSGLAAGLVAVLAMLRVPVVQALRSG